ncbi:MAG: hypothetical protein MK135_00955 [Polyangiaceae bacterium]|nr:hypothetical protein [Polyangiaceae bacterium]
MASLTATFYGLPGTLLFLAATALSVTIILIWISLERTTDTQNLDIEDALALAAPTAAEEEKRAVLRALKDLEYERSVGKISEEDYREVSSHYRAQAKQLIQAADESLKKKREFAEVRLKKLIHKNQPSPTADDDSSSSEEIK